MLRNRGNVLNDVHQAGALFLDKVGWPLVACATVKIEINQEDFLRAGLSGTRTCRPRAVVVSVENHGLSLFLARAFWFSKGVSSSEGAFSDPGVRTPSLSLRTPGLGMMMAKAGECPRSGPKMIIRSAEFR